MTKVQEDVILGVSQEGHNYTKIGTKMTKQELIERLAGYSNKEQLAFVWFDKNEIAEDLSDAEWNERCDDLITDDTIKQFAEDIINS